MNPTSSNLKSDLREGKLDANLSRIGLAPNKAAYREQIKASGGPDITRKQPNWFARHILGKQEKPQPPTAQLIRPCAGKDCKPIPTPPPKPCVGKKCPPPPPPPTPLPPPVGGVCQSGYFYGGVCQPWGYLDCNRRGDCNAHFAWVNSSYCNDILDRIRQEKLRELTLENTQGACSSGPQSTECANVTQDLQLIRLRIDQLRRQYQMCRMSAGFP